MTSLEFMLKASIWSVVLIELMLKTSIHSNDFSEIMLKASILSFAFCELMLKASISNLVNWLATLLVLRPRNQSAKSEIAISKNSQSSGEAVLIFIQTTVGNLLLA